MENRSHAIVAVSFLIVCLLGTAAGYYWLTARPDEPRHFRILTDLSVGGLQAQSPVTFKGLLVGHVQRVDLAEQQPAKVEILFTVRREAVMTESTYAVIASQGIVGGTALALKLGAGSRERLQTSRQAPARIPLRKGYLARLKNKAMTTLNSLKEVLARLQAVLDADNRQHFAAILAQLDEATRKLVTIESRLMPFVTALPGLAEKLRKTLAKSQTFLARASQAAQTAHQSLAQIRKTAETAQALLRQIRRQLPEFARLSDSLLRTSRALRKLAKQLQAHPQSLIFGAPSPPPGPGEPRFGNQEAR